MKNHGKGLDNAGGGHRPRTAFLAQRSQVFTIQTETKPAKNSFFFPVVNWLTSEFGLCKFVIGLHDAYKPFIKKPNERTNK